MIYQSSDRIQKVSRSKSKSGYLLLVLIVILVTPSATCKSENGLVVTGDRNAIFEIRRSFFDEVRVFPVLIVMQLHPDNENLAPLREDTGKNKVIWKILADPKSGDHSASEGIRRIEYGRIPSGFIQEIPKEGPPIPLSENEAYEAVGPLSLMRNAAVRFKITNGKIVTLLVPQ